MNKWILWGGAGAAALVGGLMLLRGGAAPAASTNDTASSSGGYYPPTVYGSGAGAVSSGGSGTSTDNSIASLIAGNLAVAQVQSSLTKYTSDNDKAVALATLGSQDLIARNDNQTKLAMQLANNRTDIQKVLAGQLGTITSAFGSHNGVGGTLGFTGDTINVNLHTTAAVTNGTWH